MKLFWELFPYIVILLFLTAQIVLQRRTRKEILKLLVDYGPASAHAIHVDFKTGERMPASGIPLLRPGDETLRPLLLKLEFAPRYHVFLRSLRHSWGLSSTEACADKVMRAGLEMMQLIVRYPSLCLFDRDGDGFLQFPSCLRRETEPHDMPKNAS